jgi:hypothetical protein
MHLTGITGESAESIVEYMALCGVEKAFLCPHARHSEPRDTSDSLDEICMHNDYCSDICSKAPEKLAGFCDLNPKPRFA